MSATARASLFRNPGQAGRRFLTVALVAAVALPVAAALWDLGWLPGEGPVPGEPAAARYNVTGVYGSSGWMLPIALHQIRVEQRRVVVTGSAGMVTVGAHGVVRASGAVAGECAARAGAPGQVLVSNDGSRLRVFAGQCEIDGRRS